MKKGFVVLMILCIIACTFRAVDAKTEREPAKIGTINCMNYTSKKELNQENIQRFVDHYFTTNMKKFNVPGAAVAIVKNNQELYKAGYGFSDIEKNKLVDPDTTTFPAASVSKLFTATAIMQLYQEGKLDLNENVQKYVTDITIRNSFDEPVTCHNLLTHSSGLDEQSEFSGSTLDNERIKPQKSFFDEHIPQVIVEPNTVSRYSNMGYNLLGYIVEKIAGKTYEDYIAQNILEPLNMKNSSVRMDDSNMASGYEYDNGTYVKSSFAYQYTSGSSGIISTVTDMENFMMMHLNKGSYQNHSILDYSVEQMMQEKQFSNNKVFDGMGYGFIRTSRNGVPILKHEGALPGYTTTLLLMPEQNVGIYVATNSLGGMVFDFEEAFLDYFFGTCKEVKGSSDVSYDRSEYVGTYRSYDGMSERKITKLFAVLDNTAELKIVKTADNQLKASYYTQGKKKEETKLFYQSNGILIRQDGKGYITFDENDKGEITYAFHDVSHQAYKKLGVFENTSVVGTAIIVSLVLFFGSAIVFCIKEIRKKHGNNHKLWTLVTWNNMLFAISFVGVLVLEMVMILQNMNHGIYVLKFLLTCIIIATILLVCSIIYGSLCVVNKRLSKKEVIQMAGILFVQIVFVVILGYFNMLGYHIC